MIFFNKNHKEILEIVFSKSQGPELWNFCTWHNLQVFHKDGSNYCPRVKTDPVFGINDFSIEIYEKILKIFSETISPKQ